MFALNFDTLKTFIAFFKICVKAKSFCWFKVGNLSQRQSHFKVLVGFKDL